MKDLPDHTIIFGPVPSRRLGRSVGINNIPPKACTYSCVYCQLGRTLNMRITREEFYPPAEILRQAEQKIADAGAKQEPIDYVTFVPDGEPTLDRNLGQEIASLKQCGIKIAVITNASLLWDVEVRDAVCQADWVSVKIDAATEKTWRRLNRPYRMLRLDRILRGMADFAQDFRGELTTETMLVHGFNDTQEELDPIADVITGLRPRTSYLAIPTRPPAESRARPVTEEALNLAYQALRARGLTAEYLLGYEGNAFAWTGDVAEDILSITAVHPMRADAVRAFLHKAGAGWNVIDRLLVEQKLRMLDYQGYVFYLRALQHEARNLGGAHHEY